MGDRVAMFLLAFAMTVALVGIPHIYALEEQSASATTTEAPTPFANVTLPGAGMHLPARELPVYAATTTEAPTPFANVTLPGAGMHLPARELPVYAATTTEAPG